MENVVITPGDLHENNQPLYRIDNAFPPRAFSLRTCHDPIPSTPIPTALVVPGGKYVIGYYPSWVAERNVFVRNIPAQKLTHINDAFSNVSENGECVPGNPAADVERTYSAKESVNGRDDAKSAAFHGNFNQLLELKHKYPDLKVLISIGGWSWSGDFSRAAQDDASPQRFAASCIDLYLQQSRVSSMDWISIGNIQSAAG